MNQNNCQHIWKKEGNYLVCTKCPKKVLDLKETGKEGLLEGTRKDGSKYTVRENRMSYFMPDRWIKFVEALKSPKAKLTAEVLIQLGCRINEARNIEERDIDYERNTIRLRITKTKAKKGEKKGKPRTIPVNSKFIKRLKKYFKDKKDGKSIGLLTTSAFNIAMNKALEKIEEPEGYMLSAHNIRKTHGNWLKIMGNLKMMNVDSDEICLRLGHDHNTFLKDYGSPGVMDNKDIRLIQEILGDLYVR